MTLPHASLRLTSDSRLLDIISGIESRPQRAFSVRVAYVSPSFAWFKRSGRWLRVCHKETPDGSSKATGRLENDFLVSDHQKVSDRFIP